MSIMSPKHFAIALTTMGTVCVTFALAADADPQSREDVDRIIKEQKAELESDSKVNQKSKVYPFFSRY